MLSNHPIKLVFLTLNSVLTFENWLTLSSILSKIIYVPLISYGNIQMRIQNNKQIDFYVDYWKKIY